MPCAPNDRALRGKSLLEDITHQRRAEEAERRAESLRAVTQLANAAKFQPELAVIQANPALFTKLAAYSNPAKIPPALVAQAISSSARHRPAGKKKRR